MKSIYVGNIAFSTSESDLRNLFAPFGTVDSISVVSDPDTGRARGFAFIEMSNDDEAGAAIKALDGQQAGGRLLRVSEAQPKSERGSLRGGGRGKSRNKTGEPRQPRW